MSAPTPEALHSLWVDGINRGDLDTVAALYESDAAFVVQPGRIVAGLAAVREATSVLLALRPQATLQPLVAIRASGLALLVSRWSLVGTGAGGETVRLEGQTADVARRQSDGTWRFVIDNPWGDLIAEA
jgi:uncharacterized protein (TIGR02246 family)